MRTGTQDTRPIPAVRPPAPSLWDRPWWQAIEIMILVILALVILAVVRFDWIIYSG